MDSFFVHSPAIEDICRPRKNNMPDLSHHLNASAKRRKPSPLKEMAKYMSTPGMHSLAGGMPFPAYFPFNSVDVEYQKPNSLLEKAQSTSHFNITKYGSKDGTGVDLANLLQYGAVEGHPTLLKYLKELVAIGIDPPADWETLVTCGSTDGLNKILQILSEEGDRVLVEKFTYVSFLAAAAPLGVSPIAIDIDEQGMSVKHLRSTLEAIKKSGSRMPKMLYIVTVGQNPTGTIMGVQRKKDILAIANEYDILIIEDDPYFFLQFTKASASISAQVSDQSSDSSDDEDMYRIPPVSTRGALIRMSFGGSDSEVDEKVYCKKYFDSLVPSILKYDTQGRVFRVETFSKVVAPGMRLGSITTSPVFYDALLLLSQSSSQAPSGLSMAFATKLMFEHGLKGWCRWTSGLRSQYQFRRDHMCALLDKEFKTKDGEHLASWIVPDGGMFIWLKINLSLLSCQHMSGHESTKDIMYKLWTKLAESKVLIVPGWIFAATPAIAEWKTNFFRLTYASSTIDDMDAGIQIMGTVLREFFSESGWV